MAELGPMPLLSTRVSLGGVGRRVKIKTHVMMVIFISKAQKPVGRYWTLEMVGGRWEMMRDWRGARAWARHRAWSWAQARPVTRQRRRVVEAYEIGPGVGAVMIFLCVAAAVEVTVASARGAR